MAYLIFENEQEAEARSAQAGKDKAYAFWTQGSGTKFHWGWSVEASTEDSEEEPRAYIKIDKNISVDPETDEETITIPDQNLLTDDDVLVDELPEDWTQLSETPDGND